MAEVGADTASPSGEPARKRTSKQQRSRTACKQCRQAKVKCGMTVVSRDEGNQNSPCSRCRRMGYDCEWIPDFKRTNNITRVNDLEHQLRELQTRQEQQQQTPSLSLASESLRGNATNIGTPVSPRNSQSTHQQSQAAEECYVVRDIRVSFEDADALFATFFDKYHTHLPFIARPNGPADVHSNCELLFWTILSVAARRRPPSSSFISRLTSYLSESLASIVIGTPKHWQLGHVQAVVLLSLYPPFHNTTFFGDRSLALANIALTGAMYLGLHCPGHEQEYSNLSAPPKSSSQGERIATWAACVAVAQNHSLGCGMPHPLPFDNQTIVDLLHKDDNASVPIPRDLHHYLLIQNKSYVALAALPKTYSRDYSDGAFAASLAQLISDFDHFSDRIRTASLLNQLRLASTRLHLESMYFQLEASHPARKQGLSNAYNSAISLVSDAMSADGSHDILSYSPRTTFRLFHHVACILFKLLHSSYHEGLDFNTGKIMFNAALMCMRQQAVQIHESHPDLPIRSAKVLHGLWQMGEGRPEMKHIVPELSIRTRASASVNYDCLAIYFNRVEELRRQRQDAQNSSLLSSHTTSDQVSGNLYSWNGMDASMIDFPLDLIWTEEEMDVFNFL